MSHATARALATQAGEFRVVYHTPVCPDCGSHRVIAEEVETGDQITETALICRACGTAWPLACVCEWRATVAAPAPALTAASAIGR
jgi:hypothetical protein